MKEQLLSELKDAMKCKDELRKNNITYMTSFSPIYTGKEEIDS